MFQRFFAAASVVLMLTAGAAFADEFHKPNVVNLKGKAFEEQVRNAED